MSSGRGYGVRTRGGSVGARGGRNSFSAPTGSMDSFGGRGSSGHGVGGIVSAPLRQGNTSTQGSTGRETSMESESRLMISVAGTTFTNPDVGKKAAIIVKTKFDRAWTKYSEIPEEVKKMWFAEFKRHYRWAEKDEVAVVKAFKMKCAVTVRSAFHDIRRGKSVGIWLGDAKLEILKEKWKKDPVFLETSRRNKKNACANKDRRYNKGGAISMSERVRRHELKLGRKVSIPEVFEDMNYNEKAGKWSTTESENLIHKFKKMKEDLLSQGKEVDDSQLFYKVTGGKNNKGRSFGFGSEAYKYVGSSSSGSSSTNRNPHLEDTNARLEALEDINAKLVAEIAELRSFILGKKKNVGTPDDSHSSVPFNEDDDGCDADENDITGF